MENAEDSLATPETEKENRGETLRTLCRFYSQGKRCQFGKKCRFLHHRVEATQTLKATDNMTERKPDGDEENSDCHPDVEYGVTETSGQAELTYNTRGVTGRRGQASRPCRYFLSGYCTMEDRCRFWHPGNLPPVADPGLRERSSPRIRQPVDPPTVIQDVKLSELTPAVARQLRETEINQLMKRIPKDQLVIQEREDGQLTFYRIVVQPTDPDWPYDLNEIHIMVSFPERYPQEVFTVAVPEDQDLPFVMARHVCRASEEWLQARLATNELMGKVELMFRPYLRWLDRNMERLFTEAARQLKKDVDAQRSGIQFVSYQQLQAAVCKAQPLEGEEEAVSAPSCSDEEEDVDKPEDEEAGEAAPLAEEGAVGRQVENVRSVEPRKGTEVKLLGLQLGEGTATVMARQITLSLQCNRCKVTADLVLTDGLPCTAQCEKCSAGISAAFRPSVLHRYCDVLGYLDLSNAVPVDLVLQECQLAVGCLDCSQEGPLQNVSYGQNTELNCQHCHSRLGVSVDSTRFQYIQPRSKNQTGQEDSKRRNPRDPAIQHGKPLPEKGTCRHFKQSHRWLRFPCCGRAYPCDACHDEDQDHPMERASRMLCGFCAKEQPYNNGKPCISCGGMMTRGTYTSHWEGGQGCRNKVKMSRSDRQKYTNASKTTSRKAQSEKS